jgi:hypothetical protein
MPWGDRVLERKQLRPYPARQRRRRHLSSRRELPEGQVVKRGDRVTLDIDRDKFKPDRQCAVRVRLNGDETK